jgi:hypothetical protein
MKAAMLQAAALSRADNAEGLGKMIAVQRAKTLEKERYAALSEKAMILARNNKDGAAVLYLRAILLHCDAQKINLKTSFSKYDPHGLGEIDKPLFRDMLVEWNVSKLNDEHFDNLCNFLDPDQDGHINTSVIVSFRRTSFDKFILSISCVAYLLYPFVCKNCFKLLACRTGFVDGHADAYMMWDLREACFEGNHLLMLLAIGIPSLMLYLIGFPFLGYYVLEKQQGKFGNDQALFRYGMFISGYREGFYHWESVVASRKAVFIGSSIFLSTYGPSIQTYVVLLLLLFFLFLHIYTGAYSTKTLNRLESVSLVVSYLTLYLGLGFFMGTLSENTEIYMTILIYFMNISFCLGCSGVLVKEVVFMEEHILQLWWKKCFGPKKVEDAATSRNDEGVQKIPNTKVAPTITNSPAREVGNGVQVISKEKHQFALAHIRKNYGAGSPEYNLVLLLIQRINSAKTDEELSEANNALSNFMNTKKNKHSKTREGAKQN